MHTFYKSIHIRKRSFPSTAHVPTRDWKDLSTRLAWKSAKDSFVLFRLEGEVERIFSHTQMYRAGSEKLNEMQKDRRGRDVFFHKIQVGSGRHHDSVVVCASPPPVSSGFCEKALSCFASIECAHVLCFTRKHIFCYYFFASSASDQLNLGRAGNFFHRAARSGERREKLRAEIFFFIKPDSHSIFGLIRCRSTFVS